MGNIRTRPFKLAKVKVTFYQSKTPITTTKVTFTKDVGDKDDSEVNESSHQDMNAHYIHVGRYEVMTS